MFFYVTRSVMDSEDRVPDVGKQYFILFLFISRYFGIGSVSFYFLRLKFILNFFIVVYQNDLE